MHSTNSSRRTGAVVAAALLLAACAAPAGSGSTPSASAEASVPAATASPRPTGAASPAPSPSASAEPSVTADALLGTVLTDVRTGERFTLAELAAEEPVLLEPMAVWCTNCRAQQHEVRRAHDAADFVSVSLDVDLSERPEDLAAYADREGFGWHFAMADASLYRLLQERFGVAATNPPSTPLVVIGTDGSVRPLEFGQGVRSAERLLDELGLG